MNRKSVIWLGDSRASLRDFPPDPRREAGYQLERVQSGLDPADWKPMPSVGLGVREIRVREGGAYRVIYIARFMEAVYVLHAFRKKARKALGPDLELARKRFRALLQERKQS